MKKSFLLLTIVAFLFAGCATTSLKDSNYVGKVYKNTIQLQGMDIPLPEGDWLVIGSGYVEQRIVGGSEGTKNSGTNDHFQVVLLNKTERGQVRGLVSISTDMMGNKVSGYFSNKDFNRTDVHYIVVNNNNDLDAHDCWMINHEIMSKSSSSKNSRAMKEAFVYLETNQMPLPKIMIDSYHHFTGKYNKNKYLSYSYYINPEIDGFNPPNDTNWTTCEWNKLQINKDDKKVAYIEKLKIEGTAMHEKLHAAFGE